MTVIKAKRSDLMDIRTQLKNQERLCIEEIQSLQAEWGSRPAPGKIVDLSKGGPAVSAPDDLDDILGGILKSETHLPQGDHLKDPGEEDDSEEEDDDLDGEEEEYTGTLCSVCGEPQYESPSGVVCENGHGGVLAKEVDQEEPALDDLLGELEGEDEEEGEIKDEEILPGTVSEEEVDEYLELDPPKPEAPSWNPEDEDIDIDALLGNFD
jgi:hypothetical protein